MDIKAEINRRRTFAIISHPDAGKTTLTEKLLLFGGVIQVGEAVKNNKSTVEEACPGDVIALYDTGNLKTGYSPTGGKMLTFTGISGFSPEILREVVNKVTSKSKQLEKGVR